jgi:hypothetical protein
MTFTFVLGASIEYMGTLFGWQARSRRLQQTGTLLGRERFLDFDRVAEIHLVLFGWQRGWLYFGWSCHIVYLSVSGIQQIGPGDA